MIYVRWCPSFTVKINFTSHPTESKFDVFKSQPLLIIKLYWYSQIRIHNYGFIARSFCTAQVGEDDIGIKHIYCTFHLFTPKTVSDPINDLKLWSIFLLPVKYYRSNTSYLYEPWSSTALVIGSKFCGGVIRGISHPGPSTKPPGAFSPLYKALS